jgi:hypothetical protein
MPTITGTTIKEEERMSVATSRVATSGATVRVSDRLLGTVFLLTGAFLLYLVLFDQGAAIALVLGPGSGRGNLLHEFFHDGRHLWNAACH